jgi:hypothetical protein
MLLRKIGKKADVEEGMWQLIGAIVAIALIIVSVAAIVKFIGAFFGSTKYSESKNSFKALTQQLNAMLQSKDKYAAVENQPLYIDKDLILIGYDYNLRNLGTTCGRKIDIKVVAENNFCHNKPCLCLYAMSSVYVYKVGDIIMPCYEFNENVVFLSPYNSLEEDFFQGLKKQFPPSDYYSSQTYEDLFFYGSKCRDPQGIRSEPTRLYLEKFSDGDKTYIYFSGYNNNNMNELKARKDYLSLKYNRKQTCEQIIQIKKPEETIKSYDDVVNGVMPEADLLKAAELCRDIGEPCFDKLADDLRLACSLLVTCPKEAFEIRQCDSANSQMCDFTDIACCAKKDSPGCAYESKCFSSGSATVFESKTYTCKDSQWQS